LEYGGQLVLDEVPTPTIARDEILVKIKSTLFRDGSPRCQRRCEPDRP
jgi:hypothetical protein